MERRGFEAPMDWEYQYQRPVDHTSSPFAKFSQKQPAATFDSPSKPDRGSANLFAAAMSSPLKSQEFRPPQSSLFNPHLQSKPLAAPFRNPSFITPQKHASEITFSPAESSPAMTDTSEMPAETPEVDREEADLGKMSLPSSPTKSLFGKTVLRNHASGRGEIPRGSRDKVRKRKRLQSDRDVGSARSRLALDSGESDSDWRESQGPKVGSKKGTGRQGPQRSWFGNFLSAVSDHPSAPAILSKWLQLGINFILVGIVLFGIFGIVAQIRSDLAHANEKARSLILAEMALCSDNYIKNNCSPKSARAPALDKSCNDWEMCMNQDSSAVMKVQVSVRNVAEILNEFVGVLTIKTWAFIMSLFLVAVVASNVGFGFLRESALPHPAQSAGPLHSPPAVTPMLGSAGSYHQPTFMLAPFTPQHMHKKYFANDATDTDNSPDIQSIMPPPTPSLRRSPSKGDRSWSPSKGSRGRSSGY
ncbi:hypothetical protein N656DRAFT_773075 [Canariomyces notabilis]|uniref:Brl1/Brr6 domain-containing protein n=1 Tax=Canariomyces notabilis TaxID=2074819 RepID=A0AAN6YWW3_9PEZI|nr:hypothetical protein N656DRAFT_773075 [Canariomyces arenarius]